MQLTSSSAIRGSVDVLDLFRCLSAESFTTEACRWWVRDGSFFSLRPMSNRSMDPRLSVEVSSHRY